MVRPARPNPASQVLVVLLNDGGVVGRRVLEEDRQDLLRRGVDDAQVKQQVEVVADLLVGERLSGDRLELLLVDASVVIGRGKRNQQDSQKSVTPRRHRFLTIKTGGLDFNYNIYSNIFQGCAILLQI